MEVTVKAYMYNRTTKAPAYCWVGAKNQEAIKGIEKVKNAE